MVTYEVLLKMGCSSRSLSALARSRGAFLAAVRDRTALVRVPEAEADGWETDLGAAEEVEDFAAVG